MGLAGKVVIPATLGEVLSCLVLAWLLWELARALTCVKRTVWPPVRCPRRYAAVHDHHVLRNHTYLPDCPRCAEDGTMSTS